MTTDGSFTLGCAVSAVLAVAGHPIAWDPAGHAGRCRGGLHHRSAADVAGIITNTGLYGEPRGDGFSANVNMLKTDTIFSCSGISSAARRRISSSSPRPSRRWCVLLILFLRTRLGLSIRATGDNPDMVRASSINTRVTVTIGLCAANAVTALSGAILAQYQKTADINLGTGMVIIGLASLIIGETIFGPRRHPAQGRRRGGGQRNLPLHHRRRPAAEPPGGVSQAHLCRHRGAGYRPAVPAPAA